MVLSPLVLVLRGLGIGIGIEGQNFDSIGIGIGIEGPSIDFWYWYWYWYCNPCFLRRNVAVKVQILVKLGLYKSLILPVLLYGFACVFASRADLHLLENFQKKVVRWITGKKTMSYRSQLKILNIVPLPMFLQLNDVLLLSKITNEETGTSFSLPERPEIRGRSETFKLRKTRTEKG